MNNKLYIFLLASLLVFSCTKAEVEDVYIPAGETLVKFTVDEQEPVIGNFQTKAPTSEAAINNVWVFQFDGTATTSKLVSPPKYTTNINGETFPFVQKSTTQRIVAIANTNNQYYPWGLTQDVSTYDDLLSRVRTVEQESDLYPGGAALLLYGEVLGATNVSTMSINLQHNAAKISLSLSCPANNIKITSVQLCNIPTQQALLPVGVNALAPYPTPRSVDKMDYPVITTGLPSTGSSTSRVFLWYTPTNMQGVSESTNAKTKNFFAPKEATYIKIKATNTLVPGSDITYFIHPGANVTNDYNLEPNHHYQLSVQITGINEYQVDSRIDVANTQVVDLGSKSANSYILNPPATGTTKFRIYPSQVDLYWGLYENDHDNKLRNDRAWTVELLWMDSNSLVAPQTSTTAAYISKSTGTGVNDYFEITVPAATQSGNFVIYLYKTGDSAKAALWSWHMWVTAYNPDIERIAPTDTQFVYPVTNGSVHRYRGPIWETGLYKDRFIMDRNLGQTDEMVNSSQWYYTRGVILYQFGRKDPFSFATKYTFNSTSIVRSYTEYTNVGLGYEERDIKDGIMNPNNYYWYSVYYPYTDHNTTAYRVWRDKFTSMGNLETMTNDEKSIYDPCPYGWKIPNDGTWADFRHGVTANNISRGLNYNKTTAEWPFTSGNALRYWPYVEKDGAYPVWGEIKYPLTGAYHYYMSSGVSSGSMVYMWYNSYHTSRAETASALQNSGTYFQAGVSETSNIYQWYSYSSNSLGFGMPVRCVQHGDRY